MQSRRLGSSDVQVVPLMLGGNVFGWSIDQATSFEILDAFVGHGFNFIDTADVYSNWVPGNHGGESETILGNWFKERGSRDKVILATKVGMDMGEGRKGLSKRYIIEAAEASLRRLQTDYIDLYQSHKDDPATPPEETLEGYQRLVQQGKVRLIGASNYNGVRLAEAMETAEQKGLPAYVTLQPDYNLHQRQEYEQELAPVVERFGLGVIPYFSLAAGFLTGKYKTREDVKGAKRAGVLGKFFDERGEKILRALAEIERETGAKQATISLAWLLAQPTITAPIASATNTEQLRALCAAVELKLTPVQVLRLTEASSY